MLVINDYYIKLTKKQTTVEFLSMLPISINSSFEKNE